MKETPKNTNLHKLRAMNTKNADKNFAAASSKKTVEKKKASK